MISIDSHTRQAYLANMRHELRTPLNAIIGYSEMLLEDYGPSDPPAVRDNLQNILTAGNRLLELVNEILNPTKIEEDEELDIESYSQLIHLEMRNPINVVIGYSEMTLEVCRAIGLEEFAADLEKIDQASQKLLSLIDDIIHLSRTDQLDETETNIRQDRIMVQMAEDVVTTLRSLEQESAASQAQTGHILVVDDSEEGREILVRRLKRQGHTVSEAANGLLALEILQQQNIDLVLLDVMMPEMNGYQVLRKLRADKDLRHIPVIVLSALDDVESLIRGIEVGAQDYLVKPINPVLLRARIGALIERKRLSDLQLDYVRNASTITAAAAEVEAGKFQPESLNLVAQRTDELGRLARVFQNMAYEVQAREQRLIRQVQELRIQIDSTKEAAKVAEIVETDYFQALQEKVKDLRSSFSDPTG